MMRRKGTIGPTVSTYRMMSCWPRSTRSDRRLPRCCDISANSTSKIETGRLDHLNQSPHPGVDGGFCKAEYGGRCSRIARLCRELVLQCTLNFPRTPPLHHPQSLDR